MNYQQFELLYKDIPKTDKEKCWKENKAIICRTNSFYPNDFPYLVVDSGDEFRAKFNFLEDAKSFVEDCL